MPELHNLPDSASRDEVQHQIVPKAISEGKTGLSQWGLGVHDAAWVAAMPQAEQVPVLMDHLAAEVCPVSTLLEGCPQASEAYGARAGVCVSICPNCSGFLAQEGCPARWYLMPVLLGPLHGEVEGTCVCLCGHKCEGEDEDDVTHTHMMSTTEIQA